MKLVVAAILFLSPSVSHKRAERYSSRIIKEAKRRKVDPLLVVSIIHHETGGTWREKLRSRTNDYGLMQIHVGPKVHQKYIGREHLLYRPGVNIYWGIRFLKIARWWHRKRCRRKAHHSWWVHYNWGFRVPKNRRYERSVRSILDRVRRHLEGTGAVSSVTVAPEGAGTGTSRSSAEMAFKTP